MNCNINGTTEMSLAANELTFNNGATDTSLEWATSGQLGFKVGSTIEMRLTADNLTFENGATDCGIEWATSGSFGIKVGSAIEAAVTAAGLTFGSGAAGVDYRLTANGETNDGTLDWMEDEDYWRPNDDVMIPAGESIYFSNTNQYIQDFAGAGTVLLLNAVTSFTLATGGTGRLSVTSTSLNAVSTTYDIGASQSFRDLYLSEQLRMVGIAADPTPATYALWANTTSKNLKTKRPSFSGNLAIPTVIEASTTSSTAIHTTSTKTYFDNTDNSSVAANSAVVGSCFLVEAAGVYSTKVITPGTLTIDVNWATTAVSTTGAISVAAAQTNVAWAIRVYVHVRSIGASGTVSCDLMGSVRGDVVASTNATVTVDTTAASLLQVSATWSVSDVGNTITCINYRLTQLW